MPFMTLNRRRGRAIGRAVLAAAAVAIAAPCPAAALFVVNEPWVRPAATGSTDAYMNLRSSDGTTLVGVRCEAAARATLEIPDSARRGRFRTVARIPLPAGETVRFAPGGVHVHLASVGRALKPGERVGLVLTLEAGDGTKQDVPVDAEVRHRSPRDDEMHAHGNDAPRANAH